jgi:hypothetical protein
MASEASSSSAQGSSSCKVSESQVAFMVECYLRDRRFTKTLAQFRSEASGSLNPLKSVRAISFPVLRFDPFFSMFVNLFFESGF